MAAISTFLWRVVLPAASLAAAAAAATGFAANAEEALPVSAAAMRSEGSGCCFAYGLGKLMIPCCLKTWRAADSNECGSNFELVGGARGYTDGECPATASEADALRRFGEASSCCFKFGWGSMMRPCCLERWPASNALECSGTGLAVGGAAGFAAPGTCPRTASEAAALRHAEVAAGEAGSTASALPPTGEGCCFAFGFGARMRLFGLRTWRSQDYDGCGFMPARHWVGGGRGFTSGACPETSQAAETEWRKQQREERGGCCFNIGYGDRHVPCCLETQLMSDSQECKAATRFGGARAFKPGSCPATAEEAANLIQQSRMEEPPQYTAAAGLPRPMDASSRASTALAATAAVAFVAVLAAWTGWALMRRQWFGAPSLQHEPLLQVED